MNIPRSSAIEGEHTPIIIRLILSTDLAVIQLKDSHLIIYIFQHLHFSFSFFPLMFASLF